MGSTEAASDPETTESPFYSVFFGLTPKVPLVFLAFRRDKEILRGAFGSGEIWKQTPLIFRPIGCLLLPLLSSLFSCPFAHVLCKQLQPLSTYTSGRDGEVSHL